MAAMSLARKLTILLVLVFAPLAHAQTIESGLNGGVKADPAISRGADTVTLRPYSAYTINMQVQNVTCSRDANGEIIGPLGMKEALWELSISKSNGWAFSVQPFPSGIYTVDTYGARTGLNWPAVFEGAAFAPGGQVISGTSIGGIQMGATYTDDAYSHWLILGKTNQQWIAQAISGNLHTAPINGFYYFIFGGELQKPFLDLNFTGDWDQYSLIQTFAVNPDYKEGKGRIMEAYAFRGVVINADSGAPILLISENGMFYGTSVYPF